MTFTEISSIVIRFAWVLAQARACSMITSFGSRPSFLIASTTITSHGLRRYPPARAFFLRPRLRPAEALPPSSFRTFGGRPGPRFTVASGAAFAALARSVFSSPMVSRTLFSWNISRFLSERYWFSRRSMFFSPSRSVAILRIMG